MEIDECSAGGDTGGEEDEDDASSHVSRSNSSGSSSVSGSSTSSESGDDSGDEHGSSGSDSHSSAEDEDDETENNQYLGKMESSDVMRWETCVAANERIKLPQDLCEHFAIFKELLEYPFCWEECLNESQKESLKSLLPKFPEDCDVEAETNKTLHMLFNRKIHRFGVPALDEFHSHLSAGHYRPDIRRMRNLVRKAQKRRLLFEEQKRSYELAGQLLQSRDSLISSAYKQGFSQPSNRTMSKFQWKKPQPAMVEERTQLRYLEELSALRAELGVSARLAADTTSENEENCSQYQLSGKQKRKRRVPINMQGSSIKNLQLNQEDESIRPVFSTLQRSEYIPNNSIYTRELPEEAYRAMLVAHKKRRTRRDIHPELNTQGIALADLTQRAQIGQKHKLSINTSPRSTPAKKRSKLEQSPLCHPMPRSFNISNVKAESDNSDYSHTTDDNKHFNISDIDLKMSTPIKSEVSDAHELPTVFTSKKKLNTLSTKSSKLQTLLPSLVKKEVEEIEYEDVKTEFNNHITEDLPSESGNHEDISKKEIDLDSIDMMQLPIQLDDGIDILEDVKYEEEAVISIPDKELCLSSGVDVIDANGGAELMQETHASFFSLLRDAFTSKGEYRMSTSEMKDAVTQWQSNPISPLNDWYSLATSWSALVPLALGFLAGELTYDQNLDHQPEKEHDLVPYLENKGRGVYAWIGAGRDSDSRLLDLCTKFLMHKDSLAPPKAPATTHIVTPIKQQSQLMQISNNSNVNNSGVSGRSASPLIESVSTDSSNVSNVTEWEPPRVLCPTDWKVRPSNSEEREEFRRQERMRYAAPHKAFTYRMHGYASVVGPVKGIYQHNVASGLTKPRGHSLLVADRPNFVTILALVRDATARLPNGEGTRADICQLLKDSQYIREQADSDEGYLHSVVSGALDRLHYEADPCVRYYPRRKEWLYLHRARSESEFEMYHQQLQGVTKNKKNGGNASRNKSLPTIKTTNVNKEQISNNTSKESTPKKERKSIASAQSTISRKDQRKVEEKVVVDQACSTEQPVVSTISTITSVSTPLTSIGTTTITVCTSSPSVTNVVSNIKRETVSTDTKTQMVATPSKKITNISGKPVTVVKNAQSLLQSNQQHFPHHQIQVSTSAGLQTIRLSGHSVLHSAQSIPASTSTSTSSTQSNLTTIFPTTKVQNQQSQQQTIVTNQVGKSILQTANIKQQQTQQQVLPGKTLLASQIKLVSSGQIKSLLTGHGLQGQTIFIKQSSPSGQPQQLQQQQSQQTQQIKQQQPQMQQRVITGQQQSIQTPGMQRIIAQIGGKPIAVQIQPSPQQQQQQQKILAKVLTSSGSGQLISVESLLAQKGLKLATTTSHANQLNRQGKQIIQTQYQVVSQAQATPGQSKIIVSSQQQPQSQTQTVRMVTAQLAGKPIVLASGNKSVGVGVSSTGGMVLGKQQTSQQSAQTQQQQPIILPSQVLNIKTLHGLKVIPTPTGLKTTGAAVYARVIAPTTITSTQSATSQQPAQIQAQPSRNNSFGAP